jgi:ribosomal protein L29
MAKAKEYREMTAEALKAKVGKLENTSILRSLRKDIARAQTVLGQKATQA